MKTKVWFMLAGLMLMAATVRAQEDPIVAPAIQFIEGFNKGDVNAAFATCAGGETVIVDEFPPFVWAGANACQSWAADFEKNAKATGVTEAKVTYGQPFREEVNGDTAYVVMPTAYIYKQKGQRMQEDAQMTLVMVKQDGAWKIRSWTWAGEKPEAGE